MTVCVGVGECGWDEKYQAAVHTLENMYVQMPCLLGSRIPISKLLLGQRQGEITRRLVGRYSACKCSLFPFLLEDALFL